MIKALDQFDRDESFNKRSDWNASAADRIPFPHYSKLSEKLLDLPGFNHPLGISMLPKGRNFASESEAFGVSQKTRPFLIEGDARASFICAWRFWRNWASEADPRFVSLPADTRIPDHSIWHHMGITSAFQGALPTPEQKQAYPSEDLRPRLLLFSIGPVQDFIAAARSTRDLWSGSYLLSHLISSTLGTIAKDVGPDQVMFPNLLDQPLIDQYLCEDVYDCVNFDGASVSQGLGSTTDPAKLQKLLTPSLPNRFLALLPARLPHDQTTVDDYASALSEDLTDKLGDIADSVADFIGSKPSAGVYFDRTNFDSQVAKLLEVHWHTLPIPDSIDELIGNEEAWEKLLPEDCEGYTPRKALRAIMAMAMKCPPQYPINPTAGWGLMNALISWMHDGVKARRSFDAWREGRWSSGKAFNKDQLNGKEEAVFHIEGKPEEVANYCSKKLEMSNGTFKPGELLGASTLIKRLWHETWLIGDDVIGVSKKQMQDAMPMPNTRSIAAGRPFAKDERDGVDEKDTKNRYFAVLALDGDEMGKWISGAKAPLMSHSMSPKAVDYYASHEPDFLKAPRAVTPSWHLQFSEALGNFSLHAVQRIVEAFNGRLIYAGGDDVLAMLPASEALTCARALRAAFRGEKDLNTLAEGVVVGSGERRKSDRETPLFAVQNEGYLQLHRDSGALSGDKAKLLSDPVDFPALVPGLAADVSVGIAIAHYKAPLQDVVRAAQAAEKRAKRNARDGGLGRTAVAISLFKRSGEILEWGCKWSVADSESSADSNGYRLLSTLIAELGPKGRLNGRFTHKLESLLTPYLSGSTAIQTHQAFESAFGAVLAAELDHCLARNDGGQLSPEIRELFIAYWDELQTSMVESDFSARLTRFINLLRTAAWMKRQEEAKTDGSSARPSSLTTA